jgi:hypothetical protein
MKRFPSPASETLVLVLTLTALACGSSHTLKNIQLSPATADAKNYGGQVQFTATGSLNGMPRQPLKSPQIFWCTGTTAGRCAGNIVQGASIDQNGLAQCNTNFSGTVTVLAGTATPPPNPDGGAQLKIFGSAQLTCP